MALRAPVQRSCARVYPERRQSTRGKSRRKAHARTRSCSMSLRSRASLHARLTERVHLES
eukprot:1638311-Pleurochrysis_carterae.AAC.1